MLALIIIGAVVAVLGAMLLAIALAPNVAGPAAQPPVRSEDAPAEPGVDNEIPPAETQAAATQPIPAQEPEKVQPNSEPPTPVAIAERHDEADLPLNPLQLKAVEILAGQVERLQAEYVRIGQEREHLAQELLTSWLITQFEDSAGRLKSDARQETHDLQHQLVKVSAEFERVEFRLASLQKLQSRLDDPRITRQIDDLVNAVRRLAGER